MVRLIPNYWPQLWQPFKINQWTRISLSCGFRKNLIYLWYGSFFTIEYKCDKLLKSASEPVSDCAVFSQKNALTYGMAHLG